MNIEFAAVVLGSVVAATETVRVCWYLWDMETRLDDRECDGVPQHRLRVYITPECFSCEEAVLIAAEMTQKFPQIITEIVNLQDPCASKPDSVFAVPTYVLDGKVLSLGNPYREQLFARITEVLSADVALSA